MVLVAVILPVCRAQNVDRVRQFQSLIPSVVQARQKTGNKVIAVDFSGFPVAGVLQDCVHPDDTGHEMLGSWWYDFVTQVSRDWMVELEGPPPDRTVVGEGSDDTGGQSSSSASIETTSGPSATAAVTTGGSPSSQGQGVDKLNQVSGLISSWAGLLWACVGTVVVAMS